MPASNLIVAGRGQSSNREPSRIHEGQARVQGDYTETGSMAKDRYCRKCGQEAQPEDQFCGNCWRPVHATARVPTPEADVSVPPPPQQAEDRSAPPQAPQTRPGAARVHTA